MLKQKMVNAACPRPDVRMISKMSPGVNTIMSSNNAANTMNILARIIEYLLFNRSNIYDSDHYSSISIIIIFDLKRKDPPEADPFLSRNVDMTYPPFFTASLRALAARNFGTSIGGT